MGEIGIPVIWLLLCYAVVVYAGRKGRSQIGFFVLSLFLTPQKYRRRLSTHADFVSSGTAHLWLGNSLRFPVI